jgi:hypothetical protein
MEIELLVPETESATTSCESDRLHMENASVERTSRLDIADGKNEVVKAVNGHGSGMSVFGSNAFVLEKCVASPIERSLIGQGHDRA